MLAEEAKIKSILRVGFGYRAVRRPPASRVFAKTVEFTVDRGVAEARVVLFQCR